MLNLINAITAGTAIFLALMIVTVRKDVNVRANRRLGVFILLVGLFMLDDSLVVYGIYRNNPQLIGFLNLPMFALAPTLYLSISAFVTIEPTFRKRDIWHYVPFILFVLLSLPLLSASNEQKLKVLDSLGEPLDWPDKIVLALLVIQTLVYLFLSFQKLRRYRKNLENLTAAPDEIDLDWLRYFLFGVLAMVVIWFSQLFLQPVQSDAEWYTPVNLWVIYTLGYFALRQKEVFPYSIEDAAEVGEMMHENEMPAIKRRLILSEERLSLLKAGLLKKLETDKPYLDPELNLLGLARQMQLNLHEMSELVNEGFGENFAQLIKRYRVEESKRLLLSEKFAHLNMVGIAYEAGFNSKTAFNTAFKSITGITPTAFRENNGLC
jgi:AraC-like DNA-binding protein